jgi:hypothetical protein
MAKKNSYMSVKALDIGAIQHVAMDSGSMDDLMNGCNYTASGDGVLVVDVDSLENATSEVAGKVLEVLPKDFRGLVYITW